MPMNNSEVKKRIKEKIPGRYGDGNGLYLRITNEHTPLWVVRYSLQKKRREITIGQYPQLSLHKARLQASEIKSKAKTGDDPRDEATIAKAIQSSEIPTMDKLAELWVAYKKKNIKTWSKNQRHYEKDIQPVIGQLRPDQVTPMMIKNMIDKVAVPGRMSVANDVLQYAKELFFYGQRLGVVSANPALSFTYKDAGGMEYSRQRAMSINELKEILDAMRRHHMAFSRDNFLNVALLLTLMSRKTELIAARIDEFDLGAGVWNIPVDRINAQRASNKKQPARIPLEPEVVEWIMELKYRAGCSSYLFPARRTGKRFEHASPDTLNAAIGKMFRLGYFPNTIKHFTIHDFRRTSRTQMSKLGIDFIVAERCLGHSIGKIEETYNLDDYFEKRREAQRSLLDVYGPLINQGG